MKHYVTVLLIVALAVFPVSSFAVCTPGRTCNTGPGPQGTCATCYYYFDYTCPYVSNATTQTMSCSWKTGHKFGSGSGTVDYSMIVPTGHAGSCTLAQIWVDFYDPNASSSNTLVAWVFVTHNVTPVYSNQFFSRNGSQSQITCPSFGSSTFTVSEGDRIDIEFDSNISVTTNGVPEIIVAPPIIWDNTST